MYPLGHGIQESWGRAVVEAMLTGCVPVVPVGHQFHRMLVHRESGYLCAGFEEWRDTVQALYADHGLRTRISRQASAHAREALCHPAQDRELWRQALGF